MKTTIFQKITRALATASQLIIAAPVRLPPKVVAIAKYVSLGTALLEAIGPDTKRDPAGKEDPGDGH